MAVGTFPSTHGLGKDFPGGRVPRVLAFPVCLVAVLLSGCAELQEMKIDFRHRYLAKEAWESLQDCYGEMNYEADFGRGFREGYFDVANGGNGCPPPLPPQRYWSVRYMNTAGRERTEAWFQGFRYGAMVAEQDGIGQFMELPTSLLEHSEAEKAAARRPPESPEEAVPTEEPLPTESSPEGGVEAPDAELPELPTKPLKNAPNDNGTELPELTPGGDASANPLLFPVTPGT